MAWAYWSWLLSRGRLLLRHNGTFDLSDRAAALENASEGHF